LPVVLPPPPHSLLFNATPTTAISTLSLHDALPISWWMPPPSISSGRARGSYAALISSSTAAANSSAARRPAVCGGICRRCRRRRSEEHTSELQSLTNLVCRLLLEKKK